jgi:hypothetical protein
LGSSDAAEEAKQCCLRVPATRRAVSDLKDPETRRPAQGARGSRKAAARHRAVIVHIKPHSMRLSLALRGTDVVVPTHLQAGRTSGVLARVQVAKSVF